MAVQYYVDADTLGLAHVLASLRPDVTYPGDPGGAVRKIVRPACPVTTTDVKDVDWIPVVAAAGWVIITRDRKIQRRPHELHAVTSSGARMVAIASNEVLTKWHQLEIVMTQWRRIEDLVATPGPWIYEARRSGLSKVA